MTFVQTFSMAHLIAPSLLSADFAHLGRDLDMIQQSQADMIHLDVMDGCFVPNISFGFPVIEAVAKNFNKPLDVHLMVVNPDALVTRMRDAGAHLLSVHAEACTHLHRTLQNIRSAGMKAGVAINPHTSLNVLEYVVELTDLVVMMSVNPGFGGQKFIPATFQKLKDLNELRKKWNALFQIEIDGGVDLQNAPQLLSSGADILVAGNTIFKSDNPVDTIAQLKQIKL
jgi:ribulose-phosphate 3-epimerase